jgi:hypothetical protein
METNDSLGSDLKQILTDTTPQLAQLACCCQGRCEEVFCTSLYVYSLYIIIDKQTRHKCLNTR